MKEKFEIAFECEFEAEELGPAVKLRFNITEAGKRADEDKASTFVCSIPQRGTDRTDWTEDVYKALRRGLKGALTHEARLLFWDALGFHYEASGFDPNPVGRRELAEIHLNQTAARVGTFLRTKGQRSPWTRVELERAISHALRSAKRQKRTYEGVVEALEVSYPHKAPPTVAALKQLVRRLGVDWKGLKKAAESNATLPPRPKK